MLTYPAGTKDRQLEFSGKNMKVVSQAMQLLAFLQRRQFMLRELQSRQGPVGD